jgi:hypothetical protein
MSPRLQLRYLLVALRRLAAAVSAATEASGEQRWENRSWGRAATDGFVHALELAHTAAFPLEQPGEPWTARDRPVAFLIGRRQAEAIVPVARRVRIYRFTGDVEAVRSRRLDEFDVVPDERLDALGWEIFLLAAARGDTWSDALNLATGGSYLSRAQEGSR